MKKDQLKAFLEWYDSIPEDYDWCFQSELYQYCLQDCKILAQCVVKFHDMVVALAGIDPFKQPIITIAGLCLHCFKTYDLAPQTIGIIPDRRKGYIPHVNQSKKAVAYMDYLSLKRNVKIQHQHNGGEVKIKTLAKTRELPVDGYISPPGKGKGKGHIISFLGCFWHGHITHFNHKLKHPHK